MHFDAETYAKINRFQRREAENYLEKYSDRIKWKSNPSVLDLGSGDGGITSTILKKYLPSDFKELRGVDISENMVEHANKRYREDKLSFSVMDIAGDVPEDFKENFDLIFSSFSFNWIKNQKKAFQNVHDMLVEDGTFLMLSGARTEMYEVYKELANSEKWKNHVTNQNYMCVYHLLKDPLSEIKTIMEEVGFKNIEVNSKQGFHVYDDIDFFKGLLKSANILKVPKEVLDEHVNDTVNLAIERNVLKKSDDNTVKFELTVIQAYGNK